MSETKRDPYDVLRVGRAATAREVKSAYFALVREFPPETHPVEFQELRDAYEVLSDPERREQLDASHEALATLGTEEAALLRAAQGAFAQGDAAGGEALLRRLVTDHPDLLAAREQLGLALLRRKAWAEATQCWAELAERDPGNPRHHLHLGYARHGGGAPAEAEPCFRRALELGGGDEARGALAEALDDAGRWKRAVEVLDEGIAAAGAGAPPALVRRKVAILLLHRRAGTAWRALDQLAASLAGREAERAAHADELASLAGWLFARRHHRLANGLLRRLAAVDPARPPDRLFPERITLPVSALPPASVDWLEGKVERPPRFAVSLGSRTRSALLALLPGALATWWAAWAGSGEEPWSDERVRWLLVLFVAAALLLVFGGQRFHAALTARLPRLRVMHPLYYLEVDYDLVRAFPVVNLHDVRVVRHGNATGYTHTIVHLPFGRRERRVVLRYDGDATHLAQGLLDRRQRAIELMVNNLLSTEEGIELLPPAVVARGRWPFPLRPALALGGGALAAGLVAFWVALTVNVRAVEARDWDEARLAGTPEAVESFLAQHPSRADLPRGELASRSRRIEEELAARPPGPGRELSLAMVRALAAGTPRRVGLEIAWSPASGGGAAVPASTGTAAAGPLACPFPPAEANDAVAAALQRALDRALGEGAIRLGGGSVPEAISLRVSIVARTAGAFRAAGEAGLPAVATSALDYSLAIRIPGAAGREVRGTVPPPGAITLPARWRAGPSPGEPCDEVAREQARRLARALAGAFGTVAPETGVSP